MAKIKGFKGFDKDLKCRGFQYEVGKDYTKSGEICCSSSGFHFCENPLRVFGYYRPSDSRYCEVDGDGKIDRDNSKVAVSHIHIGKELGLNEMVDAAVEFILEKAKMDETLATNTVSYSAATNTGSYSVAKNTGDCSAATNTGSYSVATNTGSYSVATNTVSYSAATNTGACSAATNTGDCSAAKNTGACSAATNTGSYSVATNTGTCSVATNTGACSVATNTGACSAATNTGDCSVATNTGDCSAATNTGDRSAATVSGKDSVAIVTGKGCKAAGALGCWLVLAERDDNMRIVKMKAVIVDGEQIKANVYYALKGGEIIEAND